MSDPESNISFNLRQRLPQSHPFSVLSHANEKQLRLRELSKTIPVGDFSQMLNNIDQYHLIAKLKSDYIQRKLRTVNWDIHNGTLTRMQLRASL